MIDFIKFKDSVINLENVFAISLMKESSSILFYTENLSDSYCVHFSDEEELNSSWHELIEKTNAR